MKKSHVPNIVPAIILLAALGSCEDIIHPELESAPPVLVVDAWINNKPEPQVVKLTSSQPYFEQTVPPGVLGAVVTITDNHGTIFPFVADKVVSGNYVWTPLPGQGFGSVGDSYRLSIQVNGELFEASSYMGRVPLIDSLSFTEEVWGVGTGRTEPFANFWATDPDGIGDAYWIRSYKNGVPLSKPSEINMAFDAGLSIGGQTDGVTFIRPIRVRINSNDKNADDESIPPISAGDSINVQIHSITVAAFTFLTELRIQTDRPGGFQELFATSLANVSTNVVNRSPVGTKVQGFFNVSAVSTGGKRYVE